MRIYSLRRLKDIGASEKTLVETFKLFVRPMIEMCAPLWTGALLRNKKLTDKINKVQRYVCRIIRPELPPELAETVLGLGSLEERRIKMSKKCAENMAADPRFAHLFKPTHSRNLRRVNKFSEPSWKLYRYGYSSIPFFIRLLNEDKDRKGC